LMRVIKYIRSLLGKHVQEDTCQKKIPLKSHNIALNTIRYSRIGLAEF